MDAGKVSDLEQRFSQEQVTSLWIAAVAATGDEGFGLKVARHIRPSTFHVVGYAMANSASLKRAAQRFARSARLVSDSAAVSFTAGADVCVLEADLNIHGRPPIYQTIDTILGGFHLLCEWIRSAPVTPVEVAFKHAAPADAAPYAELFRCPVRFGAAANAIVYRTSDMDQSVPSANEEVAMLLDELTATYLARRFEMRCSRKVREALIGQFPNGEPSKQETARRVGMTERTLLRRLRDENTTFQEVLDHLREELAYTYLQREDLSMEQIASLLGFSSNSTFSRAFVRWTGERPSNWREGQRKLAPAGPRRGAVQGLPYADAMPPSIGRMAPER
jgi:AraC-like DNA-binding protein